MVNIIVTGGAGFIGSAVVRELLNNTEHQVCNIDKLTYAGNLESLASVESSAKYTFRQADIVNTAEMTSIFDEFEPDIIMNLAAESHVDRSIDGPAEFMTTNIIGTFNLLEVARAYTSKLAAEGKTQKASKFRFHHISTDEVYGTLGPEGLFTEQTPYAPNSPYSSSKASSDHLVRAWNETYGLPTVQTNCSNNYGPYHFPEKLIPLVILNALEGKDLPIYGDGKQVRDWLFVEDHARALIKVVLEGKVGQTYNVGGHNEKQNIEVVTTICEILDELRPKASGSYTEQITFVKDRPGHDQRYAIDASKIQRELGWQPEETFESGIRKTVEWYLANGDWCEAVTKNKYSRERIGLNA